MYPVPKNGEVIRRMIKKFLFAALATMPLFAAPAFSETMDSTFRTLKPSAHTTSEA